METKDEIKKTYGRGSGEQEYNPIPIIKNRYRKHSRIFESGHSKYPQTGAYAVAKLK